MYRKKQNKTKLNKNITRFLENDNSNTLIELYNNLGKDAKRNNEDYYITPKFKLSYAESEIKHILFRFAEFNNLPEDEVEFINSLTVFDFKDEIENTLIPKNFDEFKNIEKE